ncbi:MAG: RDD family protein [Egibacteraceae bacterium]
MLRRGGAWALDVVLVALLVYTGATVVMLAIGPTVRFSAGEGTAMLDTRMVIVNAVLTVVISGSYFILSWRLAGASPAQRLLRLRVWGAMEGEPLSWRQAVLRWAFLFPPFGIFAVMSISLPAVNTLAWYLAPVWYMFLLATTILNTRRQGVHDRIAGSNVC